MALISKDWVPLDSRVGGLTAEIFKRPQFSWNLMFGLEIVSYFNYVTIIISLHNVKMFNMANVVKTHFSGK